jgi:uncharacterized protein YsxB (DUF464 family)
LISIEVFSSNGIYTGLKLTGHAPTSFGSPGENILCAAVSVLSQTLYLYCKKNYIVFSERIEKGFLGFSIEESLSSSVPFDMFLEGITNLEVQYPNSIQISYKGGIYGT